MPQKFVTVAKFFDPMAAQLVKNRLESEGIRVFLNGDASGGTFPGLGGAFNSVYVQVFEDDLEQAQAILEAADEEMTDDSSPGSTAITDREAFRDKAPSATDQAASEEIQATPRSPANAATTESGITREPLPAEEPTVGGEDADSPVVHWRSDDLATRAWRAAVFALILMALVYPFSGGLGYPFSGGLFLVGVPVQCYSLWLLARLALMQEDLGSRQTWQLYGALAGNVAGFFLILARCLYPWFWWI